MITEKDLKSYISESYYEFTSKSIAMDTLITCTEELTSVVQLSESSTSSFSGHEANTV